MSGPKRHIAAVWRQHMSLRELLINHKLWNCSNPYSICSYESNINMQISWLTGNEQSKQGKTGGQYMIDNRESTA